MAKTTKVLYGTILIFIAACMILLSIQEVPEIVWNHMISYSYNVESNVSENTLEEMNDKTKAVITATNAEAVNVESKISDIQTKANTKTTNNFPEVGYLFLLAGNQPKSMGDYLLNAICMGTIIGGLVNLIFVLKQKGKQLIKSLMILFIFLVIMDLVLAILPLTVRNVSLQLPVFTEVGAAISIKQFARNLLSYFIWVVALIVLEKVYRQYAINRLKSMTLGVPVSGKAQEQKYEEILTEQNAIQLANEIKVEAQMLSDRREGRRLASIQKLEEEKKEESKNTKKTKK
jgi:hypothetical protein